MAYLAQQTAMATKTLIRVLGSKLDDITDT